MKTVLKFFPMLNQAWETLVDVLTKVLVGLLIIIGVVSVLTLLVAGAMGHSHLMTASLAVMGLDLVLLVAAFVPVDSSAD